MKNIVVLEDDPLFRELIVDELNQIENFQCIGSYSKIKELMTNLPELSPDLFWFDISLPDGNSTDYIAQIKQQFPGALCILCTMHDDDEHVFDSLKSGADGYLLKTTPLEKMMEGVVELFEGGSPMSPFIARKVLNSFKATTENQLNGLKNLTKREMEILNSLAQGYLYKEIAHEHSISLETVKKHVQNIYKKLHVQNRTEAIIKFLKEK